MERTAVKSSQITSIGYDAESSTLEIEFRGGSVYRYADVPKDVVKALTSAESIGTYFGRNIRYVYKTSKQVGTSFVPLDDGHASVVSQAMLKRLLVEKGIWSGDGQALAGSAMREVFIASKNNPGSGALMLEWFPTLKQSEASAAIEYLKTLP